MADAVLTSRDRSGIGRIVLNRPERHNAFDEALIRELHEAVTGLGKDQRVRVILLSGKGKSFCAGADLGWMRRAAGFTNKENFEDALRLSAMLDAVRTVRKPVIALAHGAVMGGGAGLVACADIAFASIDAKFAFSEVRLGLIPATISPYVIAAVGPRHASRYLLTGERFGAETAKDIGLVHGVVEEAEALAAEGHKFAEDALLQCAPDAVAETKRLIAEVTGRPIDQGLRRATAKRIAEVRARPEAKEGLQAFFAKRNPAWRKGDG